MATSNTWPYWSRAEETEQCMGTNQREKCLRHLGSTSSCGSLQPEHGATELQRSRRDCSSVLTAPAGKLAEQFPAMESWIPGRHQVTPWCELPGWGGKELKTGFCPSRTLCFPEENTPASESGWCGAASEKVYPRTEHSCSDVHVRCPRINPKTGS